MAPPSAAIEAQPSAAWPAAARPGHADFELAKLVALVAMAADHYGKIVDPQVLDATHAFGRLAFPLFAAIIGARLALDDGLGTRYLRSLLPWAVVSQPIYVACGRDWLDANILFTLALGVVATIALRDLSTRSQPTAIATLAAVSAASAFVDYGPLGVAMIPAMAFAVARLGPRGLWLAGIAGLAANGVWAMPPFEAADVAALAAAPLLAASVMARCRLPRLPAAVYYGFYPGHLLALHLWALSLG
jgi:hypothetical protein